MTTDKQQLEPCPFCGGTDIDHEGVSSFKPEYRSKDMNWEDHATPERIQHKPACNNCGATTEGDWNTHPAPSNEAALEALELMNRTIYATSKRKNYMERLEKAVETIRAALQQPQGVERYITVKECDHYLRLPSSDTQPSVMSYKNAYLALKQTPPPPVDVDLEPYLRNLTNLLYTDFERYQNNAEMNEDDLEQFMRASILAAYKHHLAPLIRVPEWQPIETAPSGVAVLTFEPDEDLGDGIEIATKAFDGVWDCRGYKRGHYKPTHWAHLLAPPAQEND